MRFALVVFDNGHLAGARAIRGRGHPRVLGANNNWGGQSDRAGCPTRRPGFRTRRRSTLRLAYQENPAPTARPPRLCTADRRSKRCRARASTTFRGGGEEARHARRGAARELDWRHHSSQLDLLLDPRSCHRRSGARCLLACRRCPAQDFRYHHRVLASQALAHASNTSRISV